MAIVTNHMLRKKLGEVQQQSQIGIRGISTPTNTGLDANNENTITITENKSTQYKTNTWYVPMVQKPNCIHPSLV
jgi:hypothetical protein